jgi:HSP20 family protein
MVNQRTLLTYPQRQNRNLFDLSDLKLPSDSPKSMEAYMRTMNRLEQPFRGATTLQEQINRIFGDGLAHTGQESNLTPWAPAVDIFETEHELVVKADLPDVNPQDLDIRVENNILTIRGERKFDNKVSEDNYLRVERAYGSFSRSFSLANSVNSEAIKADYQNGVLMLSIPKREEAKPKQIKVNVGTPALSQSAPQQKSMAAVAGDR